KCICHGGSRWPRWAVWHCLSGSGGLGSLVGQLSRTGELSLTGSGPAFCDETGPDCRVQLGTRMGYAVSAFLVRDEVFSLLLRTFGIHGDLALGGSGARTGGHPLVESRPPNKAEHPNPAVPSFHPRPDP